MNDGTTGLRIISPERRIFAASSAIVFDRKLKNNLIIPHESLRQSLQNVRYTYC